VHEKYLDSIAHLLPSWTQFLSNNCCNQTV